RARAGNGPRPRAARRHLAGGAFRALALAGHRRGHPGRERNPGGGRRHRPGAPPVRGPAPAGPAGGPAARRFSRDGGAGLSARLRPRGMASPRDRLPGVPGGVRLSRHPAGDAVRHPAVHAARGGVRAGRARHGRGRGGRHPGRLALADLPAGDASQRGARGAVGADADRRPRAGRVRRGRRGGRRHQRPHADRHHLHLRRPGGAQPRRRVRHGASPGTAQPGAAAAAPPPQDPTGARM
ncbi:MAG: Sulfate transport system permease protein CysW, partial [uncultured Gemmatimonadetes bacterium]